MIGPTSDIILGSKLPLTKQTLSRFFHHHWQDKDTIHRSAIYLAKEVMVFWSKVRILTKMEQHVVTKIEKCVDKYQKFKKNKYRKSKTQKQKECDFLKELDILFDIANQNPMQMMTIEEDKQFLLAQRTRRQVCMLSVDQKLTRKERKIAERRAKEKERKKQKETRKETSTKSILTLKKSDESSETDFEDDAMKKNILSLKALKLALTNLKL